MNRFRVPFSPKLLATLLAIVSSFSLWSQEKKSTPLFDLLGSPDGIIMQPTDPFDHFLLKVSGPDALHFQQYFAGDQALEISNVGPDSQPLADGTYHYEVVAAPFVDETLKNLMLSARINQDHDLLKALRESGEIPTGHRYSGTFAIIDGQIAIAGSAAPEARKGAEDHGGSPPVDADPGNNDDIILDDLIVIGSTCIGFDCVDGETFNYDTLRLKENNLRIHFQDTSISPSYPTNDWRILANDVVSGGDSYLGIEDANTSRIPFRITAGARNHALFVDSQGELGLGTSTPATELHMVSGDSPTLRLEQDASSGFAAQTWEVAGNETNFFVRDINAGTMPFRVRPDAPTNALYVEDNGDIGVNTASPDATLHVTGDDGDTKLLVVETNDDDGVRNLLEVLNVAGPAEIRINTGTTAGDASGAWILRGDNGSNNLYIDQGNDASEEFVLDKDGNLTITGDLTAAGTLYSSDRHIKEEFEVVDPTLVLDQVSALPISTWNFIDDSHKSRHMGPMAQDFHAAFGLGSDETRIHSTDTFGVALAAIQGLNLKLAEKDRELQTLRTEKDDAIIALQDQNRQLQQRLEKLEALVEAKLNP